MFASNRWGVVREVTPASIRCVCTVGMTFGAADSTLP